MSDRATGLARSRVIAVLGPTNTGKTHFAVERMLSHPTGMIGLPLRLLAREVYDRIVKLRGVRSVALITGEEKIIPPRADYLVCTVEAMPLGREVDFLAVDEIQLCADRERGHVFTQRLLHARGRKETLFLGALTVQHLIRKLLPDAEFIVRERLSKLTYTGSKKLTRLPRRSAVVAFSADNVYAIAELIRRQRGGAAVVMGALSPRTRNAQVALYQSGEVDFLVATDAIGMGLNMDVDHLAFAGLRKFDGRRTRHLTPQEIGQIAGRAGRYRSPGTFGVTGEAFDIDEDLVEAVEAHRFEPLQAAEWRSSRLDFSSLNALLASLARPADREGLKLAEESLDETTLRALAKDDGVITRAKDRSALFALWDACQTPDFRKTTPDDHIRLVRTIFEHLTSRQRRLPTDWIAGQLKSLDRLDGEIDRLAQRLAGVRTLAYAANRGDWLADAQHWQARCREVEDRLSDTLHEKLMQRFIDRRTSALLRGLSQGGEVLAGVGGDGAVTVEGHVVGQLTGLRFDLEKGDGALADKALRQAAQRAVAPELSRRLGRLAADPDNAFSLTSAGMILWRGGPSGRLSGGGPFQPKVTLLTEMGAAVSQERASRRMEAFVAAEAGRRLAPLRLLEAAMSEGRVSGLARGLSFRLIEAGGVVDRSEVAADVAMLSQKERRDMRSAGVRFGAFSLYLPALLEPDAMMFAAAFAHLEAPHWKPRREGLIPLPQPQPSGRVLSAFGLRAVGGFGVAVETLEALDARLRETPPVRISGGAGVALPEDLADTLGWPKETLSWILKGLGFTVARRATKDAPALWRRRAAGKVIRKSPQVETSSPFAVLADFKPVVPPKRRPGPVSADKLSPPSVARRRRRRKPRPIPA